MGRRRSRPHINFLPAKISRTQILEEKKKLITIASIEERKELPIHKGEILEPQPECCIYRVPKDLRNINKAAYTPKVISIGPLHHGKKELDDMEKQKIRFKREFSKRIPTEKWQEFITFIEKHEQRIRNCYEEKPKLQKIEFITMILYDAIFIIELFLRYFYRIQSEFLLFKPRLRAAIRLDLQLVENQLPYFLLKGLYKLAFPEPNAKAERYPPFFLLSCLFFQDGMFNGIPEEVEVKHFTDLRRYILTRIHPRHSFGFPGNLPCAHRLQESGVKFKGVATHCLLDLKFEKKMLRIPCFNVFKIPIWKVCELQIPRIQIVDGTECLIRNVMALEQCHYPLQTHVCNYIHLLDILIDTEEDVKCLVETGVISNYMGDSKTVANIINKLCLQISASPSCYFEIIKGLKSHYDNSWNHAKATLRSVYFSNLWRGTATFAAIMLLFLTLIQTICSILQVV
ncbi:hypothetical protein OWV82_022013 [Melia azedarach]|uniref:Uncharacterized protein n=1 Tax=Melia azedarach TaxID=155640 RepID=A0ACC1X3J7_MELAZ|nr:hypothetical protein OWV82_022013 [Melia azedarach]